MSQALLASIAASIRRERAQAGLSMSELAKRAGVAKSTLSQLEAGAGNPSLETMWALATALGIPFSQLMDPHVGTVEVIRAGEGASVAAQESDYAATLLSASPPSARRDVYRVTAEPSSIRRSQPHPPGTVEHVYIATGSARVGPTATPIDLEAGDFITYPGDQPHIFEATAPGTTAVFISEQR